MNIEQLDEILFSESALGDQLLRLAPVALVDQAHAAQHDGLTANETAMGRRARMVPAEMTAYAARGEIAPKGIPPYGKNSESRVTNSPPECHSARIVACASSTRATGLAQSTPYGLLPSRSPGPMPRMARPRVSTCRVAAACAVTAGFGRPASVTLTPRRSRPSRFLAPK